MATTPGMRFKDWLLKQGVVSAEQLELAVQRKKKTGVKIGQALVDLNIISEQ